MQSNCSSFRTVSLHININHIKHGGSIILKDAVSFDFNKWSIEPEFEAYVKQLAQQIGKTSKTLKVQIKVLLLNLYDVWKSNEKFIRYSRRRVDYTKSKQNRTNRTGVSYKLVEVIDSLIEIGLVEHHIGFNDRTTNISRQSRIRATPELIDQMDNAGFYVEAIFQHPESEIVLLRDPNVKSYWKSTEGSPTTYKDTPTIKSIREDVESYNRMLCESDIDISGDSTEIDLRRKTVKRIFNDGTFDHGGRFYGGWWSTCKSSRRKNILINNIETVELDYQCLHGRLLYSIENKVFNGDIYQVQGFERNVCKKAFLVLLNATTKRGTIKALDGVDSNNKSNKTPS